MKIFVKMLEMHSNMRCCYKEKKSLEDITFSKLNRKLNARVEWVALILNKVFLNVIPLQL